MRFGKKVRIAVQRHFSLVENDSVHMNGGRVSSFFRLDVADILGNEVDVCESKRTEWTFILVSEIAVLNNKAVDPQRINRQQSVLPTFIFDRNFIFFFL